MWQRQCRQAFRPSGRQAFRPSGALAGRGLLGCSRSARDLLACSEAERCASASVGPEGVTPVALSVRVFRRGRRGVGPLDHVSGRYDPRWESLALTQGWYLTDQGKRARQQRRSGNPLHTFSLTPLALQNLHRPRKPEIRYLYTVRTRPRQNSAAIDRGAARAPRSKSVELFVCNPTIETRYRGVKTRGRVSHSHYTGAPPCCVKSSFGGAQV